MSNLELQQQKKRVATRQALVFSFGREIWGDLYEAFPLRIRFVFDGGCEEVVGGAALSTDRELRSPTDSRPAGPAGPEQSLIKRHLKRHLKGT